MLRLSTVLGGSTASGTLSSKSTRARRGRLRSVRNPRTLPLTLCCRHRNYSCSELSVEDLVRVQRVSWTWLATISGSPALQRYMFLAADEARLWWRISGLMTNMAAWRRKRSSRLPTKSLWTMIVWSLASSTRSSSRWSSTRSRESIAQDAERNS